VNLCFHGIEGTGVLATILGISDGYKTEKKTPTERELSADDIGIGIRL